MNEIYKLSDELDDIIKKIDDNLPKLNAYLDRASQYGAFTETDDWKVIALPNIPVPSDIVETINILGHKQNDLIDEQYFKYKEIVTLCDNECLRIVKAKAKGIGRLKAKYFKEAVQFGPIKALENLKKEIDSEEKTEP